MKAVFQALKTLLAQYYKELFSPEKKIAWCTSVGPAEILRSAPEVEVYFPENHGALIGATRQAGELIPLALQQGYSPNICSYLTSDIGAHLKGESPLKRYGIPAPPKPDVLVYNTYQCREVKEWFSYYHRLYQVPLIGLDLPRNQAWEPGAMEKLHRISWENFIQTYKKLFPSFSKERFHRVLKLSAKACKLWQELLALNRKNPAPLTFFDHCILMAPAVVLRGREEAVTFYQKALSSAQTMQKEKKKGIRLYWEGMPIWGKLRFLSEFFSSRGAEVVASTYGDSWAFDFDENQPLESMIQAYGTIFISQKEEDKEAYLMRMIETYAIDGIIYHDAWTCPYNTNTHFGLPQRLYKKTGIPYVIIYGDLVDMRHFAEEEFRNRMEAFLETL